MKYPNLELLEYKFRLEVEKLFHLNDWFHYDIEAVVFSQVWGTTSLGFDWHGGLSGQAFTGAYVTAFTLTTPNETICGVFFGDRIAYLIKDPPTEFFKQLAAWNAPSQVQVKRKYCDKVFIR